MGDRKLPVAHFLLYTNRGKPLLIRYFSQIFDRIAVLYFTLDPNHPSFRRNPFRDLTQALRSGKSNLIGLMISDIGNYFWGPLIANLTQLFSHSGYTVIVRSYYRDADRKQKLTTEMSSQNFSGMILLADSSMDYFYQTFVQANIPTIVIDQIPDSFHQMPVDCVLCDSYHGSRAIAEHLISEGHRHIYVNAPIAHSYNIFSTDFKATHETNVW